MTVCQTVVAAHAVPIPLSLHPVLLRHVPHVHPVLPTLLIRQLQLLPQPDLIF